MAKLTPHALASLLAKHANRTVFVTGAGVSTDSGIPDYRGPSGDSSGYKAPITSQDFDQNAKTRQRYWARSLRGFNALSNAQPNAAHHALAALESLGLSSAVITQNVDRLHHKAGSRNVVELHGRADLVECHTCQHAMRRSEYHDMLVALNPEYFETHLPLRLRPDGDADLGGDADYTSFKVQACPKCNGDGFFKVHARRCPPRR
jgi:NAD-dependent deacetylase sirtuin 4